MNLEVFPSRNKLIDIHDHLMIPASNALSVVESAGFRVDIPKVAEMAKGYEKKLQQLEDDVRSYPEVLSYERCKGSKFNLGSPDQVRFLYFEILKLPTEGIPKTPTGVFSVDKDVKEKLRAHQILNLVQDVHQASSRAHLRG
jgi:DNA polymerase-1